MSSARGLSPCSRAPFIALAMNAAEGTQRLARLALSARGSRVAAFRQINFNIKRKF
jgi:hypothetical protein